MVVVVLRDERDGAAGAGAGGGLAGGGRGVVEAGGAGGVDGYCGHHLLQVAVGRGGCEERRGGAELVRISVLQGWVRVL